MNEQHLSEERLQILAMPGETPVPAEQFHLDACPACRTRLSFYGSLFTGIESMPHARFDFNLEEAVMSALPVKSKRKWAPRLGWAVSGVLTAVLLLWAAKKYLAILVAGILPFTLYICVLSAILIFSLLASDMYRRYQKILRIVEQ